MNSSPQQRPMAGPLPDQVEARASVHLTRFSIRPDRRSELVDAARSPASSQGVPLGSAWKLLVELEDGDWLDISITRDGEGPNDGSAHLDMAEGILGDEDGAIVSCARVDDKRLSAPRHGGRTDPAAGA